MALSAGNRTRRHLISIRAYALADAATLTEIANDEEVSRYMTQAFPYPYTLDDARVWLSTASLERPIDNFAIEVDGVLAGGVGLRLATGEGSGVAEIGYWLGRAFWNRGLATEAVAKCVEYAFDVRRLRRLEAYVFAPNVTSARVLEKCNFSREGVLREAVICRDGTVADAWLYALLRRDWE